MATRSNEEQQLIAEIKANYTGFVNNSFIGNISTSGHPRILDGLLVNLIADIINRKETDEECHNLCYQIEQVISDHLKQEEDR